MHSNQVWPNLLNVEFVLHRLHVYQNTKFIFYKVKLYPELTLTRKAIVLVEKNRDETSRCKQACEENVKFSCKVYHFAIDLNPRNSSYNVGVRPNF